MLGMVMNVIMFFYRTIYTPLRLAECIYDALEGMLPHVGLALILIIQKNSKQIIKSSLSNRFFFVT